MSKTLTRAAAILLSLFLLLGTFAIIGYATGEVVVSMIAFPRGGGTDLWGRPALTLMNGWTADSATNFHALGASNHGMQIVYCVQPGVPLRTGDRNPHITPEELFGNFDNGVLNAEQVQILLGRLFQHGFGGTVSTEMTYTQITEIIATQVLVWEIIVGERNLDFSWNAPPAGVNRSLEIVRQNHPQRALIIQHYDRIVAAVQNHSTIPSFLRGSLTQATTHELTWNGTNFSTTLTDTNGVLANFNFTSTTPGVSFNRSGNNLTISTTTAPAGTVDITATRSGSRAGLVFWSNNPIHIISNIQSIVTITTAVPDNITAFVRVNASTGSIRIEKTVQGGGSAAGFEFEVRNSAGDLVGTFTSDANGLVTIPNLPAGTYTVREINIPAGYEVVGENPLTITVQPNQTAVARFTNRRMEGQIRIEKSVQGGGSAAGFEFEVRNAQNELIGTFTSGANGQVTIPNLPAGQYTVREINIPDGYEVMGENPLTITVQSNQTAVARFTNRRMDGQIRIEKYNASPAMGTPSLAGAVFEIRTAAGELVETITTNAQGIATSGSLPWGDYIVVEITAPAGFVLDPTPRTVTLNAANLSVQLRVPNTPQTGRISIQKQGNVLVGAQQIETIFGTQYLPIFEPRGLPGAVFEVRDAQGNLVDTITTGADGVATSRELPLGEYTLVEVQAPHGFVLDATPHVVTLTFAGQNVAVTTSEITIRNARQRIEIELTKRMEGHETFDRFEDVIFGLFAAEDIYSEDGELLISAGSMVIVEDSLVAMASVDADGIGRFAGELPFARYFVQELQTAEGFVLDDTRHYVDVEWAGQDYAVTRVLVNNGKVIVNEQIRGSLRIEKRCEDTRELLAGAKFGLYQNDEKIAYVVTSEDGYVVFEDLLFGEFQVRELEAPEGFMLNDEVFIVNVRENGVEIVLVVYNEPAEPPATPVPGPEPIDPPEDFPKTGDGNVLIIAALSVFALALIGGVAMVLRKNKKENSDETQEDLDDDGGDFADDDDVYSDSGC
ncbi:MAG: SpaA isopeptide-forming pilin-related protein [Oscillospiraceae bacterium]|nr:SpaA isopeptide-forming pilin-related protein [Oscillospiraceae bacterium]